MKTFLKVILAGMLMVLPFMNIVAQNANPQVLDGGLYVKVSDHAALNVANDNGKINPQDVYFLNGLVEKYQIKEMAMPFLSAKSEQMQRTFRINIADIQDVDLFIKELSQNPDIEYVERIPLYYTAAAPNDLYYNDVFEGSYLSNSLGEANSSWHLNKIQAEEAWDLTTGSNQIIVAVLENAIWIDHPDLQNKIIRAIDLADGDNDPIPPANSYTWSHGTHLAGVIGAETNNTIGVASVGNGIRLMAVKLAADASDGRAIQNGAEGIIWAADNGAHIINISWQSTEFAQTMLNAVNYATNKGCVLVASAGNSRDGENTYYPAAYENVIAVGSTDIEDNKSDFSNYGEWLDLLAPGGYATSGNIQGFGRFSVLSTTSNVAGTTDKIITEESGGAASYVSNTTNDSITGYYDVMYGTSVSAAVVSGVAGLMLSANPDLTPAKLKDILKATCDNVDDQNRNFIGEIGAGRINAFSAVSAAIDSISPLVADFSASTIFIELGETVNFTDLSTGNPTSWTWEFEGGSPRTSTGRNPQGIQYFNRGMFTVKLTVQTDNDSVQETKKSLIIVGNQPENPDDITNSSWVEQALRLPYSPELGVYKIETVDESIAWVLTFNSNTGETVLDFARTENAGDLWTPGTINIPAGYLPVDISAVDYNEAWLLTVNTTTDGGAVFKTVDGGTTWTQQATADFDTENSNAKIIRMFDQTSGYCVGDPVGNDFVIYTTTDGINWAKLDATAIPDVIPDEIAGEHVSYTIANTTWFGTSKGNLYKSTDKGLTWTKQNIAEDLEIASVSFSNATHGAVLCHGYDENTNELDSVSAFRTTNGGTAWVALPLGGRMLSDISAIPGRINQYVGIVNDFDNPENAGSYMTVNNGIIWTVIDNSVNYTSVVMVNEERGWAGGFNGPTMGGIFKWTESPVFESTPETQINEREYYRYYIEVTDPNDKDIRLNLRTTSPSWLRLIDNGDGTGWLEGQSLPITGSQVSVYPIVIEASNGVRTTTQTFSIRVVTTNKPPVFDNIDQIPTTGKVNELYSFVIEASDPDEDDNVTISAIRLPWLPAPNQNSSWLSLIDNGDGTALLSGVPSEPGTYQVEINVSDGLFNVNHEFSIVVEDDFYNVEDFGYGTISIYPNPTTDYIKIQNCQGSKYEVLDITGRTISEGLIAESEHYINMSGISKGNVFLRITNNDKTYTVKIVKM